MSFADIIPNNFQYKNFKNRYDPLQPYLAQTMCAYGNSRNTENMKGKTTVR